MKNKKIWPVLFFLRSAQLMYWLKLTCKKASCKEATNFKSISLFWFVEFLFGRSKVTILSSKLDRFYNIAVSFFQFKIPSARSFTIISCKAAAFASFRVSFSYFVFFSFRSFRSFSVLWSRGFLIRRIIFRCVWYAIHANLLSLRLHSTDNDQSMILNTSFNIFVENEKDKRNYPYFRLKVIFPFLLLFFSFFFFFIFTRRVRFSNFAVKFILLDKIEIRCLRCYIIFPSTCACSWHCCLENPCNPHKL